MQISTNILAWDIARDAAGITWLHRWALTEGKRGTFFAGEPIVPDWIEKAAAAPIR